MCASSMAGNALEESHRLVTFVLKLMNQIADFCIREKRGDGASIWATFSAMSELPPDIPSRIEVRFSPDQFERFCVGTATVLIFDGCPEVVPAPGTPDYGSLQRHLQERPSVPLLLIMADADARRLLGFIMRN